jgi:hypothetical protein
LRPPVTVARLFRSAHRARTGSVVRP